MIGYAIEDLTIQNTPVWFEIDGKELVGFVQFTPAGYSRYWIGLPARRDRRELKGITPTRWRPVNKRWPVKLPDPIDSNVEEVETVAQPSTAVTDEPYDVTVRLGRPGAPPETPEEAKARLIRHVWTGEVIEHEHQARESAWPPELMAGIRTAEKIIRATRGSSIPGWTEQDYEDFYIDQSELPALRTKFDPTPRDISDYESQTGPKSWNFSEPVLLNLRSARPIYSWSMISATLKIPEDVCISAFEKALELVCRRANVR